MVNVGNKHKCIDSESETARRSATTVRQPRQDERVQTSTRRWRHVKRGTGNDVRRGRKEEDGRRAGKRLHVKQKHVPLRVHMIQHKMKKDPEHQKGKE